MNFFIRKLKVESQFPKTICYASFSVKTVHTFHVSCCGLSLTYIRFGIHHTKSIIQTLKLTVTWQGLLERIVFDRLSGTMVLSAIPWEGIT